jgi:SAM-dependent methyltransferase
MINNFFDFNHFLSTRFCEIIGLSNNPHFLGKAWEYFDMQIASTITLIKKNNNLDRVLVLDVGCGRHSELENFRKPELGFELYAMDISAEELRFNSFADRTIVYDVCNQNFPNDLSEYKDKFDLIISHSVFEHLPEPEITHHLIHFLLKPGGLVLHKYSTLYDPLLLAGHLIPNGISRKILFFLEPFRAASGKFRTYYKTCRAYSKYSNRFFNRLNFTVLGGSNFYGSAYLRRILPLSMIFDLFYRLILAIDFSIFASCVCIFLQKPLQDHSSSS